MSRLGAVLAVLAVITSLPGVATATADELPGNLSAELRADLEAVSRLRGIALEEAHRRHTLRQSAEPAIRAALADPTRFGGAFQDDSSGSWTLRVLHVGDRAEAESRLTELLGYLPVVWERVKYSAADLERIHDEIGEFWRRSGIELMRHVLIDAPRNRVVVGTSSRNAELEADLVDLYGDAVAFETRATGEPVACDGNNDPEGGSRHNCTPWRGGIKTTAGNGSNPSYCTTMMWARRKDSAAHKFLITAGHCGNEDNQTFYHNGTAIGVSTINSLNLDDPLTDSRRIPANGNITQMNRIYETPAVRSYAITSLRAAGSQNVNDWVCKHGVGETTYGRLCGQITASGSFSVQGYSFIFVGRRADFNGTCWFACDGWGLSGGDSGAPVAYNGQLYGLATTGNGWYSLANRVETDLNVWFCLNTNCTAP